MRPSVQGVMGLTSEKTEDRCLLSACKRLSHSSKLLWISTSPWAHEVVACVRPAPTGGPSLLAPVRLSLAFRIRSSKALCISTRPSAQGVMGLTSEKTKDRCLLSASKRLSHSSKLLWISTSPWAHEVVACVRPAPTGGPSLLARVRLSLAFRIRSSKALCISTRPSAQGVMELTSEKTEDR